MTKRQLKAIASIEQQIQELTIKREKLRKRMALIYENCNHQNKTRIDGGYQQSDIIRCDDCGKFWDVL